MSGHKERAGFAYGLSDAFAYCRPTTVAEVSGLVAGEPDALLLAGGTDLLVEMRNREIRGGTLVDLKGLSQLRRIEHAYDERDAGSLPEEALKLVAHELRLKLSRARDLLALRGEPVSLDAPAGPKADGQTLGETLPDTARPLPDEEALTESLRREVERMLELLNPREAEILRCRCGLGGRSAMSLQEVGELFHLTKERIRQIEKRALRTLRHHREAIQLDAYPR